MNVFQRLPHFCRAPNGMRAADAAILLFSAIGAAPALAQSCSQWNLIFVDPAPAARSGHTMTYDSTRGKVLLYGGVAPPQLGDTWEWDGTNWTDLGISGPPARAGQRMAFDSTRGVAVLVGNSASAFQTQTWEFNGSGWTQFGGSGPSARFEHAMAFDSARGVIVLFGGSVQGDEGNFDSNETFEYDGASWTQRFPANAPTPRHNHAMAYDSDRGVTVLYGGFDSSLGGDSGETWEWDGIDWTLVASSGPPASSAAALVYSTAAQRSILVPGGAPADLPAVRTWSWDGANWLLLGSSDEMQNRSGFAAAYDSDRNTVVLFGGVAFEGEDIVAKRDTWELPSSPPPTISQQPSDVAAPVGGTAHFSVTADGTSLTYQWYKDDAPLNNDGRINGAFEATLSIAALTTDDNGVYRVVVNGNCGGAASNSADLHVWSRGDMNCDGAVNNFDIDPFVQALIDPVGYAATYPDCSTIIGDIDASGALNNFDIDPFVSLIVGG